MHEYKNPNDPRRHYEPGPHRNLPMVIAHSEEVVTVYGGEYGIEYLMNPEARMEWDRYSGVYHMVTNERTRIDPGQADDSDEPQHEQRHLMPKWLTDAAADEDAGWRYW